MKVRTYRVHPFVEVKIVEQDCSGDVTAKPPLAGLCIRQDEWFNSENPNIEFLTNVDNVVIRQYMKDVWPDENRFNFSVLNEWREWREAMKLRGLDIHFKLRLISGVFAPNWMMNQCGKFPLEKSGFETTPGFEDASDYCVKFWTDEYMTLWERLMQELSTQFDDAEFLSEVIMTASGPGTGEPMIFGIGNEGDDLVRLNQYITAGLTSENLEACLYRSIDSMAAFQRTNIGMALTQFEHITIPFFKEIETSKEIGDYMANKYGSRCILGNNGLRTDHGPNGPAWTAPHGDMWKLQMFYIKMAIKYGSRIYNQTASVNNMGGWENMVEVLDRGLTFQDCLLELPNQEADIKKHLTPQQLSYYSREYKANVV